MVISRMLPIMDMATQALECDPLGHLRLPWRMRIWDAMGPSSEDRDVALLSTGLRVRATVAIYAVRYVLSRWSDVFPEDDSPTRLLALAEARLRQEMNDEVIILKKQDLQSHLQDLPYFEFSTRLEALVGEAAFRALHVALYDEPLVHKEFDDSISEEDFDYNQWDCCFVVSAIAANGWTMTGEGCSASRKQFWKWYLHDAIPRATNEIGGDTFS